jgi:hypothetical protein
MIERWKCVGYCRHCTADQDDSTFSKEWGHFEKSGDGVWVRADSALALLASRETTLCDIREEYLHLARILRSARDLLQGEFYAEALGELDDACSHADAVNSHPTSGEQHD